MTRTLLIALVLVAAGLLASVVLVFLFRQPDTHSVSLPAMAGRTGYWKALQALARQPRFRLTVVLRGSSNHPCLAAELCSSRPVTRIELRHVMPDRTRVWRLVRDSPVLSPPFELVLSKNRFCLRIVGENTTSGKNFVCSPAHHVSLAWYINAYLLGGKTIPSTYTESTATEVIDGRRRELARFSISGKGTLGCTPAGAGAGTTSGYHWCPPINLPPSASFIATLTVDRSSGLPIGFQAVGINQGSTDNGGRVVETTAFRYGGRFGVHVPRGQPVSCMSWIPAVHCVDLKRHRG